MTHALINFSLKYRKLVLLIFGLILMGGVIAYKQLPIDAFPDVSPKLVRVFVEVNGTASEEVERFVTVPIESEMNKIPGVSRVKSVSSYGLSTIRIYFKDNVDIHLARQLVNEKIKIAEESIPDFLDIPHGVEMGATTSGTGKILAYYIEAGDKNLTEIRTLQDNVVKPFLENIDGISEILSQGGHVKQYNIIVKQDKLNEFGVSITDLANQIKNNNLDIGAGLLKLDKEELIIRSLGRIKTIEDIQSIFIKTINEKHIYLRDIAHVEIGFAERRGVASLNGQKEIVTGSVYKTPKANSFDIITKMNEKIIELNKRLPESMSVKVYYDQGDLVQKSVNTISSALLSAMFLLIVVSLVFLRKPKSIALVLMSLPFSVLFTMIVLNVSGFSGDLISFGGLVIGMGMLVDASILMVEKLHDSNQTLLHSSNIKDVIVDSSKQMSRPIRYSITIIILSFLPILTLTGIEGKMFQPLAVSVVSAMIASLFYALVIIPAVYSFLTPKRQIDQSRSGTEPGYLNIYRKILVFLLKQKRILALSSVLLLILTAFLFTKIGRIFMPIMEEGTIHVVAFMDPNVSLNEISQKSMEMEKVIKSIDEVKYAITDIGYGDIGPHVHHTSYASITVGFHPKKTWGNAKNQDDIINSIYEKLIFFPVDAISFTQPIQHEVDDLISGAGAQVVVKVFGEDMSVLKESGQNIKEVLAKIPGASDLRVEEVTGQTQLQININRNKVAQLGLNISDIQNTINYMVGGVRVGKIYNKEGYSQISLRLEESARNDIESLNNLIIVNDSKNPVKLKNIADIQEFKGLMQISRENGQRHLNIYCNVRGRDLGSFIAEAQQTVNSWVKMPIKYHIVWSGQFELQQAANKRFMFIIPLTLISILLMLYRFHDSKKEMLLMMFNIPFSIVGGVILLYLFQEDFSIPSTIGFITLFGIALQDALVLLNKFKLLRQDGLFLKDAVINGSVSKLRPALMTSLTTIFALFPLIFTSGVGSEIQRPLAIVVVGGLFSSTILTLFLIPVFYYWMEESQDKNKTNNPVPE